MPSCTTTLTVAANNNNPKGSKCNTIPASENNLGSSNCLICGSFVHMTRNCPVSP
ncbi:unnamed protein product [Mucor hiemalis]